MAVIACKHTHFSVFDILCILVHEVSPHPPLVDGLQFRWQDLDDVM
jgi:hypothetical protein